MLLPLSEQVSRIIPWIIRGHDSASTVSVFHTIWAFVDTNTTTVAMESIRQYTTLIQKMRPLLVELIRNLREKQEHDDIVVREFDPLYVNVIERYFTFLEENLRKTDPRNYELMFLELERPSKATYLDPQPKWRTQNYLQQDLFERHEKERLEGKSSYPQSGSLDLVRDQTPETLSSRFIIPRKDMPLMQQYLNQMESSFEPIGIMQSMPAAHKPTLMQSLSLAFSRLESIATVLDQISTLLWSQDMCRRLFAQVLGLSDLLVFNSAADLDTINTMALGSLYISFRKAWYHFPEHFNKDSQIPMQQEFIDSVNEEQKGDSEGSFVNMFRYYILLYKKLLNKLPVPGKFEFVRYSNLFSPLSWKKAMQPFVNAHFITHQEVIVHAYNISNARIVNGMDTFLNKILTFCTQSNKFEIIQKIIEEYKVGPSNSEIVKFIEPSDMYKSTIYIPPIFLRWKIKCMYMDLTFNALISKVEKRITPAVLSEICARFKIPIYQAPSGSTTRSTMRGTNYNVDTLRNYIDMNLLLNMPIANEWSTIRLGQHLENPSELLPEPVRHEQIHLLFGSVPIVYGYLSNKFTIQRILSDDMFSGQLFVSNEDIHTLDGASDDELKITGSHGTLQKSLLALQNILNNEFSRFPNCVSFKTGHVFTLILAACIKQLRVVVWATHYISPHPGVHLEELDDKIQNVVSNLVRVFVYLKTSEQKLCIQMFVWIVIRLLSCQIHTPEFGLGSEMKEDSPIGKGNDWNYLLTYPYILHQLLSADLLRFDYAKASQKELLNNESAKLQATFVQTQCHLQDIIMDPVLLVSDDEDNIITNSSIPEFSYRFVIKLEKHIMNSVPVFPLDKKMNPMDYNNTIVTNECYERNAYRTHYLPETFKITGLELAPRREFGFFTNPKALMFYLRKALSTMSDPLSIESSMEDVNKEKEFIAAIEEILVIFHCLLSTNNIMFPGIVICQVLPHFLPRRDTNAVLTKDRFDTETMEDLATFVTDWCSPKRSTHYFEQYDANTLTMASFDAKKKLPVIYDMHAEAIDTKSGELYSNIKEKFYQTLDTDNRKEWTASASSIKNTFDNRGVVMFGIDKEKRGLWERFHELGSTLGRAFWDKRFVEHTIMNAATHESKQEKEGKESEMKPKTITKSPSSHITRYSPDSTTVDTYFTREREYMPYVMKDVPSAEFHPQFVSSCVNVVQQTFPSNPIFVTILPALLEMKESLRSSTTPSKPFTEYFPMHSILFDFLAKTSITEVASATKFIDDNATKYPGEMDHRQGFGVGKNIYSKPKYTLHKEQLNKLYRSFITRASHTKERIDAVYPVESDERKTYIESVFRALTNSDVDNIPYKLVIMSLFHFRSDIFQNYLAPNDTIVHLIDSLLTAFYASKLKRMAVAIHNIPIPHPAHPEDDMTDHMNRVEATPLQVLANHHYTLNFAFGITNHDDILEGTTAHLNVYHLLADFMSNAQNGEFGDNVVGEDVIHAIAGVDLFVRYATSRDLEHIDWENFMLDDDLKNAQGEVVIEDTNPELIIEGLRKSGMIGRLSGPTLILNVLRTWISQLRYIPILSDVYFRNYYNLLEMFAEVSGFALKNIRRAVKREMDENRKKALKSTLNSTKNLIQRNTVEIRDRMKGSGVTTYSTLDCTLVREGEETKESKLTSFLRQPSSTNKAIRNQTKFKVIQFYVSKYAFGKQNMNPELIWLNGDHTIFKQEHES